MSRAKRADIPGILSGIQGYTGKVAYYAWPENEAPALPFIVYIFPEEAGMGADNVNYLPTTSVQVELYTKLKDPAQEGQVVTAFQRGAKLVVNVESRRGNKLTDEYSLSGFTQAWKRVNDECK